MDWKIKTFVVLSILLLSGCVVKYSFTGASVDPGIKTVYIAQFENKSPLAAPSLSPNLTEKLRDKFVSQTSIQVVTSESAARIGYLGSIIGYEVAPAGFSSANQTASLNRLSVTVEVKFFDAQDASKSWTQNFTRYADFSGSIPLSTVESTLVADISKQLSEDIFNKTFVNW
jgi:hypothetical protein